MYVTRLQHLLTDFNASFLTLVDKKHSISKDVKLGDESKFYWIPPTFR